MATRTQQIKVGVFLVVSIFIIVAGVLTMQGFNRNPTSTYHVSFKESVLGLGVGGLVEYLGVPVGGVTEIYVSDNETAEVEIEVRDDRVTLREGVRAQLVIVSFATGQMAISLKGGEGGQPLPSGSTIPASASAFASVTDQIETVMVDLNAISESLKTALSGMQEGQLTKIFEELETMLAEGTKFMESARKIADSLEADIDTTIEEYTNLAADMRKVAESADQFLRTANEKMGPVDLGQVQADLEAAMANFADASGKLSATLDKLDSVADTVIYETDNIEHAVSEGMAAMTQTLESVRTLTDTLNENPTALLRGRGNPEGR